MKCDYAVYDSACIFIFCLIILYFARNDETKLFNQSNLSHPYAGKMRSDLRCGELSANIGEPLLLWIDSIDRLPIVPVK